jgi:hypothetical protein
MTMSSVEVALRRAIEGRRVVSLVDREGRVRMVEPHMLFETKAGVRQVAVYQRSGESRTGGLPAWRHFALEDIHAMTVSEEVFSPQPSFNPSNHRMFPHIEARIPTVEELTKSSPGFSRVQRVSR